MTVRLYEDDGVLRSMQAQVLSCEKTEGGYAVVLDQTVFFPEGGGQTSDKGYIDGVRVLDVKEENGEWEIVHGTDELKDQSMATEWIHEELTAWITEQAEADEPFFAYYASPWPHAPVYAGDDFDGTTGMGTYVDCVTEVDHYLGLLFDPWRNSVYWKTRLLSLQATTAPRWRAPWADCAAANTLRMRAAKRFPL